MREEEAHELAVIQAGNQCPPWVPLGPRRHPEPDCQREPLPPLSPRVWSRLARSRLCAHTRSSARRYRRRDGHRHTLRVMRRHCHTLHRKSWRISWRQSAGHALPREPGGRELRGELVLSSAPFSSREQEQKTGKPSMRAAPVSRSTISESRAWTAWAPGWLLSRSCLAPRGSHSKSDDGGR